MQDGYAAIVYFNSQPHEEADIISHRKKEMANYFNSQPHEEADCLVLNLLRHNLYFNSQPHEEADHSGFSRTFRARVFQLTASRRG